MPYNNLQLLSFRNYCNDYIKRNIEIRYPHLSSQEKHFKLQNQFKTIMNNIRHLTTTTELNKYNTPMGFLFQYIKPDITHIIAMCSSPNDKLYLERQLFTNFDWNIKLFQNIKTLNAKDLLIWFFLYIPYYSSNYNSHIDLNKYRILYESLLTYFIENDKDDIWNSKYYLTEDEFLFISNDTWMTYAIAYHNQNNTSILSKYCQLLRKICPFINYYSGKLAQRILKTENKTQSIQDNEYTKPKKQICFITDSFHTDSSVLRDRISIIGKMDKKLYDVYIASFQPLETITGHIGKIFFQNTYHQSHFIYLGVSGNYDSKNKILTTARNILENYNFDYIIYPDLGMKILPTLLAFSRIAKTQMTTWGHSQTSGIDTIDYYISSSWFESDISLSQTHYTEKLILLPSLGTYYISPTKLFINNNPFLKDKQFKTREELGFPVDISMYSCLQTFYKITPEFENTLAKILELDPTGIILLSNSFPYCQSHLNRIYNILGPTKILRLKWYTSLSKKEYLNLISISNVVLDPFPFGGCNTSYDAFDFNIPVITYPSHFLHGRFTLGLYMKMGLNDCECITYNIDEYANIATQIALNPKLQHKINRNIEMNKHHIFQDDNSINDWNTLFINY